MNTTPSTAVGDVTAPGAINATRVRECLTAALAPEALHVHDDSAAHAGHAGSSGADQGTHFNVRVVSAAFAGCNRVARHRLVYDALRSMMGTSSAPGIHALAIVALTPDEAKQAP
jgi:BolA family transcriptional regulator, general stress-responsive regulator